MRLDFTLPGFSVGQQPLPEPPPPPPEPPKKVDAQKQLFGRDKRRQRSASIRNMGGAGGLSIGGSLQTALKALTGQ